MLKELAEDPETKAGLKFFAHIINLVYETGRKIVEELKESMRIVFDNYLGQWNKVAIVQNSNKMTKLIYAHS